ncbi:hypothetical protein PIB30_099622, partial [Stylosanthes scabra]|nr:hypothetical protein [Stylosanthes scabra]
PSIWVKFCPKVRVHHHFLHKQLCWRKKAACAAPFAAWATSVVASELLAQLSSCVGSFLLCGQLLLVLVQPASNSTSNNPSFLISPHESFASNVLFSLSKSFFNP